MSEIKSMKLYTNVERIYRELGRTVEEPLSVDELCAFDQLRYHGTQAQVNRHFQSGKLGGVRLNRGWRCE